jgi:hypothetical protein
MREMMCVCGVFERDKRGTAAGNEGREGCELRGLKDGHSERGVG